MRVAPARRPAWRVLLWPSLATLTALCLLLALGAWQLQRRAWKEGLIAQITARAYGEPGVIVPEASWLDWRASDDEFRRVRLQGTFLHDREVLVHGLLALQRGAPAQGFYVFTPLSLDTGAVVLINRGFVPTELRAVGQRAAGQVPGPAVVTGLVRAPEARTPFVPENDPTRNSWFVRDVDGMARARGLDRAAPFYVDADATPNPGGWPRGGETRLALPNNHLQYAMTWFGIALTLLAVFGVFAKRRLEMLGTEPPRPAARGQP